MKIEIPIGDGLVVVEDVNGNVNMTMTIGANGVVLMMPATEAVYVSQALQEVARIAGQQMAKRKL